MSLLEKLRGTVTVGNVSYRETGVQMEIALEQLDLWR